MRRKHPTAGGDGAGGRSRVPRMSATPLFDATPLAGAHGARGIGAAVAGMIEGFAALPVQERPRLILAARQDAPAGFSHTRIRRPPWPAAMGRLRLPDPWPALSGERRLRRGAGGAVIHATAPELIPPGPTVATCYDLIPSAFPGDYLTGPGRAAIAAAHRRQLARLRGADMVVAISRGTADDLVDLAGVDPGRIRVVPLAAPPAVEPVGTGLGGGYVLYSGSLEPHKNLPVLLDAVGRLPGKPRLRLVMTGTWSPRRLERLRAHAAAVGAAGRVEWLGHLPAGRLARVRADALAVVVPSRKEGFGLPVLEAMAAGVPVLASDIPALREVAGDAATLLPPGDPDAWAGAVLALAGDGEARADAARRGRERAAGFTWERTARALAGVYAEAAA